MTDLTNSKAHFIADFADLSLHEKVKNTINNEGSIAQRGVESLVALFYKVTSIGVRNYSAF